MENIRSHITALGLAVMVGLTVWLAAPSAWAQQEAPAAEAQAAPAEDKPSFSVSMDILTQYVWRGVAFSKHSAVLQPSMTASYKGFSVNIWGNFDTNERNPFGVTPDRKNPKWNETDFTVSYTRELFKDFSVTGGIIYYALDGNNSTDDSFEIFAGLGYKIPVIDVGVGVTVYREVSHFPGTYLEWYLSRSFALPFAGASLDLYAGWSAEFSNDNAVFPTPDGSKFSGLYAGQLRAAVNFPVTKNITISPKIIYWYAMGDDSTFAIDNLSWDRKHNHVLGGVSVAATF